MAQKLVSPQENKNEDDDGPLNTLTIAGIAAAAGMVALAAAVFIIGRENTIMMLPPM
jgi:hypothetical protein